MSITRVIGCVTAAILLAPAAIGTGSAQERAAGAGEALPEAVREATARFRDVDDAIAAGYVSSGTCVSGPEEGAMGVHFANPALFDDVLDITQPEVLVYEPRHNGRLQLVAAEYVTPAAAWQSTHAPGDQPALAGHLFHYVAGPNRYGPAAFYELHVWAWRTNPRGPFADWNPQVSCASWRGDGF